MTDNTVEIEDNRFVEMAIRHGLLHPEHVDKILDHARKTHVQPSDAALTLSMLELYEVDAINLLCRPADLSPGYELTSLIGCGAGGMVFRARQTALGRDVALKTINVRARNASTTGQSRIQREAHAIARLHHPNIVTAHDSGFHQGRFCIAMELVEGETLSDFINRNSPVPANITWCIVRQVASALSHANEFGITHRDIKPANLLLCDAPSGMQLPDGVPFVKVADFGLAFESEEEDASQITAAGTTLGTPAYVAPEQLHDTHVDAKADIYSLGATAYHMLTGNPPYAEQSAMRTIMQKTVGDDRWRDDAASMGSEGTVALFRDMTEPKSEDRLGDYQELIARIDELLKNPDALLERAPAKKPAEPEAEPVGVDRGESNPFHRLSKRTVMIAVLMLIGMGVASALWIVQPNATSSPNTPLAKWNLDGFPRPLFDGKSVPLFQQSGGFWQAGAAKDGGRVLVGQEGCLMTIPLTLDGDPSPNVRFRVSLIDETANIVELALLQSVEPQEGEVPEFEENGILRFQEDTVEFNSVLGTEEASSTRSMRFPTASPDEAVLQRITLERQGDQALFSVNGKMIGSIQCEDQATCSIQLRCIQHASSFADIDITHLAPATTPINQ